MCTGVGLRTNSNYMGGMASDLVSGCLNRILVLRGGPGADAALCTNFAPKLGFKAAVLRLVRSNQEASWALARQAGEAGLATMTCSG